MSREHVFVWSLRTQWIPAALILLGLLLMVWYAPRCVPVGEPRYGERPPWAEEPYTFDATNMPLGEARARSNGKPLLLDFYLPGWQPCDYLDEHVLRHPDVRAALGAFYTVKYITGDEHASAAEKKYGVYGYPTVIVIRPDGTHIRPISSREARGFVKQLRHALESAR